MLNFHPAFSDVLPNSVGDWRTRAKATQPADISYLSPLGAHPARWTEALLEVVNDEPGFLAMFFPRLWFQRRIHLPFYYLRVSASSWEKWKDPSASPLRLWLILWGTVWKQMLPPESISIGLSPSASEEHAMCSPRAGHFHTPVCVPASPRVSFLVLEPRSPWVNVCWGVASLFS